jgi:hypothetical protein
MSSELERLRAVVVEVGYPGGESWARARNALTNAIAVERDDEACARSASTLIARRRATTAPRVGRRVLGVAAATLGATAVVLVVLLASPGRDGTSNAIADPLLVAARAALHQPSLFPRDNQYFYVRTEGRALAGMSVRGGGSITASETIVRDEWRSVERPGLQRTRIVSEQFTSRADARRWRTNGGAAIGTATTLHLGATHYYLVSNDGSPAELTRREVLALPTNPRALLARTVSGLSGSRAWLATLGTSGSRPSSQTQYTYTYTARTASAAAPSPGLPTRPVVRNDGYVYAYGAFTSIADDFLQGTLPSRLRSALYGALALIPGVQYVGTRRDLVGRRGAEITFSDLEHHLRDELIFNPHTSSLLGEREVVVGAGTGFTTGTPIVNLAFLNEGVTNTTAVPHTDEIR